MEVYFLITFWLAAILAADGLARAKNRNGTGWALITLLAPMFLLTLFCLPSLPANTAVAAKPPEPAKPAAPAGPWEHVN